VLEAETAGVGSWLVFIVDHNLLYRMIYSMYYLGGDVSEAETWKFAKIPYGT
jgi:hypothetical protein